MTPEAAKLIARVDQRRAALRNMIAGMTPEMFKKLMDGLADRENDEEEEIVERFIATAAILGIGAVLEARHMGGADDE